MLDLLRDYASKLGLTNIRPVLSEPHDAALPQGQVDLALLVDVYHEFSHPREMLRSIRRSLKADGRLVLLEYRKEDPSVPILEDHKMSVKTVRAELEPEGFVLDKLYSQLPRQHLLVFRKKAD
jgi:ubiquinone/menaquinone biosynthesis C-methylase UbiE